jgi:hypothetical protein
MLHRSSKYIDFIHKYFKYENINHSSAEGTSVLSDFNALDDGRIGRNT